MEMCDPEFDENYTMGYLITLYHFKTNKSNEHVDIDEDELAL